VARLDVRAPRGRAARALRRGAGDRRLRARPGTSTLARLGGGLGPLAGLATGLAVASSRAPLAAVCAVDAPLAHPAVLEALLDRLGSAPAAVPRSQGRPQPLFAVYRSELAQLAAELLAAGERRAASLGERAGALFVERAELLAVPAVAAFDPELASFLSLDDAHAYAGALAAPEPLVRVAGFAGATQLRASSVGRARRLLAADVVPQSSASVPVDDETPLYAGDTLG
jgi:molybdenum cofactor guanylyltransferase